MISCLGVEVDKRATWTYLKKYQLNTKLGKTLYFRFHAAPGFDKNIRINSDGSRHGFHIDLRVFQDQTFSNVKNYLITDPNEGGATNVDLVYSYTVDMSPLYFAIGYINPEYPNTIYINNGTEDRVYLEISDSQDFPSGAHTFYEHVKNNLPN